MARTITESIKELHSSLTEYIEATYHISDPQLVSQRRELLERLGVIYQQPYLESTPRYIAGDKFGSIPKIPPSSLKLFESLSSEAEDAQRIIYNPPYKHQLQSIAECLVKGRNLVIMTGTGSGKTESFLLPIMGKFAREAHENPLAFHKSKAVRAMILYPMNALVNDQLGRLRGLFMDKRLKDLFQDWSGRIPTFARYTSRTPYPGVRSSKRDQTRLKSFENFYVEIERTVKDQSSSNREAASVLKSQLENRGKWPSKPNLTSWFGSKGEHWQDNQTGEFQRAITLIDDSELITRHEIHASPPDLLITNYSMLEYMLMRPIERPVFEQTRQWLAENPEEKFTIVLDEAHLYRGAAGAEVGLLMRRLQDRLEIGEQRFQVICATASFKDSEYAPKFAGQLAGVSSGSFSTVVGDYSFTEAEIGTEKDAEILAKLNLDEFYGSVNDDERKQMVEPLLNYRRVAQKPDKDVFNLLYESLKNFKVMGLLINSTMKAATPISKLGSILFPTVKIEVADKAVTNLLSLGSMAREKENAIGLLPCRIHNFFRGLPGLWVCINPNCTKLSSEPKNRICGKLFGQPRDRCDCGSKVFEFFTCRHCGSPYFRAYTDSVSNPSALWSEPGESIRLITSEIYDLFPLDVLLKEPEDLGTVEIANIDLATGQLNPENLGENFRKVFLRRNRINHSADDTDEMRINIGSLGEFIPCGVCGRRAGYGASSVQNHQTKGDQPFLSLLSRQIQIQPPSLKRDQSPTDKFAPLHGRKVLIFSDSRQVAARLAPNLQMYSFRDVTRPLLVWGMRKLQTNRLIESQLSIDDSFFALVLAANKFNVRLRPELKSSENFSSVDNEIATAIKNGVLENESELFQLYSSLLTEQAPESLLRDIVSTINDRFLGLEPLALASIREKSRHTARVADFPSIPGVAESKEAKIELTRFWLRCWREHQGYWLKDMTENWWQSPKGISGHKTGKFESFANFLSNKDAVKRFNKEWLPELLKLFTHEMNGIYRIMGRNLTFDFGDNWLRCRHCTSVHRPILDILRCQECGSQSLDCLNQNDEVFQARKGYYRNHTLNILTEHPDPPFALVAAEHTAQLNAPQGEEVFSQAEINELLFQDINLSWPLDKKQAYAIDILSSTTTMEVGIDIGALSGVALRNMPPSRANYQQRAGRAGRRGNAVATVVAFGSVDSHDEHYFSTPDEMISGPVVDPILTLNSPDIAKRHIRAFLLQRYHQTRLPEIPPSEQPDLFSVLGKVDAFKTKNAILNRADFEEWLNENRDKLQSRIRRWIPKELSKKDSNTLVDGMVLDCLTAIDDAINYSTTTENSSEISLEEDLIEIEETDDLGKTEDSSNLLDRLLYCGVLPRYAFPTEVATFHIFDVNQSTPFRAVMKFAPSQALPVALSQYAPGKQVWVSNKCYTSGAIYSSIPGERQEAWKGKRLYYECTECGFGKTETFLEANRKDVRDCEACLGKMTFESRSWFRPTGFAHPAYNPEETSPDNVSEASYATRAKLQMPFNDDTGWVFVNDRISTLPKRPHLLVSNSGPGGKGYDYCTSCGRIEATQNLSNILFAPHEKPYPDKERICNAGYTARGIVLGTDFITDICLFALRVKEPMKLKPGYFSTNVALRTVCEALSKAAAQILDIEPNDIVAESRPALNPIGQKGLEVEIFLYDTLPGGAGFSCQLSNRTEELFEWALKIMKECKEECDSSCYRCLRTFKNKFEHSLLDRHLGIELLEYLISGNYSKPNHNRVLQSLSLLYEDLSRNKPHNLNCELSKPFNSTAFGELIAPILVSRDDGMKFIVSLSGSLTPDISLDMDIRKIAHENLSPDLLLLKPIDESLVRNNLPSATKFVISSAINY